MIPDIRYPSSSAALFGRNVFAPPQRSPNDTLAIAAAHDSAAAELRVVTGEGDTVTISAHRAVDATYASYRPGESSRSGGAFASLAVDRQLDVSVTGDLSPEEARDVQRLVSQLKSVISRFLRGNTQGLERQRLQFGDLETIARIDLRLEHSQDVTLVQGFAGGKDNPTTPVAPADSGSGVVRVAPNDPAATVAPQDDSNPETLRPLAESGTLAEQALARARDLNLPPGAMRKLFPPAMQQILRHSSHDPEFTTIRKMLEDLRREVMQRLNGDVPA